VRHSTISRRASWTFAPGACRRTRWSASSTRPSSIRAALTGDGAGKITGTDWSQIKERYADSILEWIDDAFLPGIRKRIVARSVQSPVDYERRMRSAVQGTHQHGAFLPYQVGGFRPIPEFADYRSPVANVYLCGAGSHPGSGITMGPGRNAAEAICGDLKLTFPGKTFAKV